MEDAYSRFPFGRGRSTRGLSLGSPAQKRRSLHEGANTRGAAYSHRWRLAF
jgi:hypothetical protein